MSKLQLLFLIEGLRSKPSLFPSYYVADRLLVKVMGQWVENWWAIAGVYCTDIVVHVKLQTMNSKKERRRCLQTAKTAGKFGGSACGRKWHLASLQVPPQSSEYKEYASGCGGTCALPAAIFAPLGRKAELIRACRSPWGF